VRAAFKQLKSEGIVAPTRGLGNRIISKPSEIRKRNREKTVGVLIPEPVGSLRPFIALWIDALKELLMESDCRLRVHQGRHFYLANPNRALDRIVGQSSHDAWVLTLSSRAMQAWFAQRGVPCIVAGSLFDGIDLPYFDVDHRATCRHAAGVLTRQGHRRIGFLGRESQRAGDMDSELGFLEGVRATSHRDTTADIAYHRDDVDSVTRALQRLLGKHEAPTGIVVCNSYAYLAAASLLAARGLRIPQDISLISRDDDPFLRFVVPTPARYVMSPHAFAKKVVGAVLQLTARDPVTHSKTRLVPQFAAGGSTGPAKVTVTATGRS
jgi:LacI family transcriptional regulator